MSKPSTLPATAASTDAETDPTEPLALETAAWLRVGQAPPGLLTVDEAAGWLRISRRQLVARADIPRVDIAPPGAKRPQWRYRLAELEELIGFRAGVGRLQLRTA